MTILVLLFNARHRRVISAKTDVTDNLDKWIENTVEGLTTCLGFRLRHVMKNKEFGFTLSQYTQLQNELVYLERYFTPSCE